MSTPTGEPAYVRFTRLYNRHRFHYEHQEGLCFYCRQPMALPDPTRHHADPLPPDRVTVEHLVTMADAGRDPHHRRHHYRPTVAACHACNKQRGTIPWQTFLTRKLIQRWRPQ